MDGFETLAALAAHCQAVTVANGPAFLALFLAGLVGSASHCAGMCGPFVLAQTAGRMSTIPLVGAPRYLELRRLGAGLSMPYQAGRATTYILGGAVLAAPFGVLDGLTDWPYLATVLLASAAAIFAWQAARGFGLQVPGLVGDRLARRVQPLLRAPFGWRGYLLGILLGFLPCGLLYGALAAAAATADPLAAAIGMAGFVLGTIPALWAVGYLGARAGDVWRSLARRMMPYIAGFNAILLLGMAVRATQFG